MDLKTVEIEVGFQGKPAGVHDKLFVDIPADTPAAQVEAAAKKAFEKMVATWQTHYVFRGARRVLTPRPRRDDEIDNGGW